MAWRLNSEHICSVCLICYFSPLVYRIKSWLQITPMKIIQLGLAIQHPQLRSAFEQLFREETQIELLFSAENETQLFNQTPKLNPSIIILDSELHFPNILSTIKKLSLDYSNLQLIILTPEIDPYITALYTEAGASKTLPYSVDYEVLIDFIK